VLIPGRGAAQLKIEAQLPTLLALTETLKPILSQPLRNLLKPNSNFTAESMKISTSNSLCLVTYAAFIHAGLTTRY